MSTQEKIPKRRGLGSRLDVRVRVVGVWATMFPHHKTMTSLQCDWSFEIRTLLIQ